MQKGFDEKTKSTAFESLASKFSAVDAGYIPDDAFTKIFAQAAVSTCRFANARTDEESEGRAPRRKSIGYSFQRKPPMINRGAANVLQSVQRVLIGDIDFQVITLALSARDRRLSDTLPPQNV